MDIVIENLKKNFGEKCAVNIPNYTIHSGDLLGLVGNNGAGKSTLFRLIMDLIKADEGTVRMVGNFQEQQVDIDVKTTEDWKEWTGSFIDEGFLIDYLTPDEYFAFVAKICGVSQDALEAHLALYERFMNGEVLGQKKLIRNLSAVNKQKVGIIAAMIQQPKVLILDEPFNFLDPSSQSAIKHILQQYNKETGATILISSHNLNHTTDICPRIALLENGVIIRDIMNENNSAEKELEEYFEIKD
ncbi:MAG: ATP-binding cassette domain-containing protein [Bacteroidales bacterium]|nr:ATP-binding cassette domain-containing protein [Candidatus Minthousia equi]